MFSTPIALERWGGIYENDDYIIGLTNLEIATTLSRRAMQNMMTLFISTWNKEVMSINDWSINTNIPSNVSQPAIPQPTVPASEK